MESHLPIRQVMGKFLKLFMMNNKITPLTHREIMPINTDKDGCCRCIKAQYANCICANFARDDGMTATAIMEIWYED